MTTNFDNYPISILPLLRDVSVRLLGCHCDGLLILARVDNVPQFVNAQTLAVKTPGIGPALSAIVTRYLLL